MIKKKKTEGGLAYLDVRNACAHAKIALQGAHLFHYQPRGESPLLWLSNTSFFAKGKAIRGGVPVCWPWFGRHKTDSRLPQHGFARTFFWTLSAVHERDEDTTEVSLQLTSSPESLRLWPHRFELLLRVTIGKTLEIALRTMNCDEKSFELSSALHSYFAVSDIEKVAVQGLEETAYFDALTKKTQTQKGKVYIREEVDRIYQNVHRPLSLHDQGRTIHINSKGSASAVVWNPWIDKSARMIDMEDDAYKTMLCIETANALSDSRRLEPGETHTLKVFICDGLPPI